MPRSIQNFKGKVFEYQFTTMTICVSRYGSPRVSFPILIKKSK